MKGWTLPLYSLLVVSAIARVTNGQVELSSNLKDGSTCPNQPVTAKCKVYNSSLQSWIFSPFIPKLDPVTFDPSSVVGAPLVRSNNGLMIEANVTEITEVANGVAHITSTLSFHATPDVDGNTVVCKGEAGNNDSLSIVVRDAVILPADFSCTNTSMNCEQSYMQYRCTWSQVIDTFNFTVSDSDNVIFQEMTFQTNDNKHVQVSVTCNSFATITIKAFRTCNSTTQSLADTTTLSAICDGVCPVGSGGLSGGAIAGIVIGILIVVGITIVLITTAVFFLKRREKSVKMFLFLIKPDVANTSKVDDIVSMLKDNGLIIVKKVKRTLTKDEVQKLYGHLSANKNYDYEALVTFMISGPCILLAVRSSSGGDFTAKQKTIAEVLEATGALKERIREEFGKDLIANAVHSSDTIDGAQRELSIVFPSKYVTF